MAHSRGVDEGGLASRLGGLRVCRWCLGRLFEEEPEAARARGEELARRLGIELRDEECELCGGLLSRINERAEEAAELLSGVEYDKFYVGVSIPRRAQELEDELRAELRLPTGASAKRLAARMLAAAISERTGRRADPSRPDAIVEVRADGKCSLRLRPVYLEGSYVKADPSVAWSAPRCNACGGRGCELCHFTGVSEDPPSVERALKEILIDAFSARQVSIGWTGTDDVGVSVDGRGRAFAAKVSGAAAMRSWYRRVRMRGSGASLTMLRETTKEGYAELLGLRRYDLVRAELRMEGDLAASAARRLEEAYRWLELELVRDDGRTRRRAVGCMRVLRAEGRELEVRLCAEHGFNLRKLFSCRESEELSRERARPSMRDVLGFGCAEVSGYVVEDVLDSCPCPRERTASGSALGTSPGAGGVPPPGEGQVDPVEHHRVEQREDRR